MICRGSCDNADSSEDLIIDVENTRLQFDIGLRRGDWVYTASVPFINNSAGEFEKARANLLAILLEFFIC